MRKNLQSYHLPKLLIGLCAVLFWCMLVVGQSAADRLFLTEESLRAVNTDPARSLCHFSMLENWKYHAGDDPLWASPIFDDTHWHTLGPPDDDRWHMPESIDWQGVGWFRKHVTLGSGAQKQRLALLLYQAGAMEIYINGKRVYQNGRIEQGRLVQNGKLVLVDLPHLVALDLEDADQLLIAVRFAVANVKSKMTLGIPTWWGIGLGLYHDAYLHRDNQIRERTIFQMLAGIPLAFAVLHFLFYLFYRRAKGNLYYAILATGTALLIFTPMYFAFSTEHINGLFTLFKMSLICTILMSLKFYYYEFFQRMPRYWPFIAWPGYVLAAFSWTIPIQYVYFLSFLGFPELIRIVSKAICRNRPGAWIIAVGLAIFVITCSHQMLIELDVIRRTDLYLYVYGIVSLIISMSVYLAYTFGATSRQLETQVVEVQRLSDENIKQAQLAREQERQNRERETTRKVLEAENQLRTMELDAAQKRQEMLEDLAESNQALRLTQAQLVQAEKMASLGNLVAGIAHEINTPIGAINSMHDSLVRAIDRLETEVKKRMPEEHLAQNDIQNSFRVIGEANRVIATGSERVREIVRSLRNFARLDEADWKRVDVHEGIESTLALVQHDFRNRIELHREYGVIPNVECFPGRLNQVFLNLLVNASQAIEGKGKITIRTFLKDERVHVAIEDTGKGIAQENLSKIFESGFTTKKAGLGTGLGLSICRQIVDAHKGEIAVESTEGVGSVFTVKLPVVQSSKDRVFT